MKCSKCGTENPESAKFCNERGGELKEGEENQSIKKCPNCGFYVGDKNKCDSCGYSIKTGNEPKTNSLIDIVKNNIDKIIMISSICLLIVVLTIIIAVSVSDKAVSSEAKTLAVPVKDIAAAIVIHKHFVRYLFFIFKRCSLLFMNIPLLPYIKVCILTLKTVRIKY